MRSRILCIIVAAAVTVAMLPAMVFADSSSDVQKNSQLKVISSISKQAGTVKSNGGKYETKNFSGISSFDVEYLHPGKANISLTLEEKLTSDKEICISVNSYDKCYILSTADYLGQDQISGAIDIPCVSGSVTIKAQIFRDEAEGDSITKTVQAEALSMPAKGYSTRINANKVTLLWGYVSYADGYKIYKNGRLIKTIKDNSKTYTSYSKKGAGKAGYRVKAYVYKKKYAQTYYSAYSAKISPKPNKVSKYVYLDVKSRTYPSCDFVVKSISLSGKTYTVTGYALNCRIFEAKKYSRLSIKIYCGSQLVAKKKFKNIRLNIKEYGKKKLVLKIKGKAGADLYVNGASWSISALPKW